MSREERIANFHRQLDSIRTLMENAREEYGQYLDEFERLFGEKEREKYEEAHA